jgi:hypothetical protein
MKTKGLLAAIAFILAIGSAVGSEKLLTQPAWTHIIDVPDQGAECVERDDCSTTGNDCQISVEVAGVPKMVPGYDHSFSDETTCGFLLGRL